MKKAILLLTTILISIISFAQSESEHLTFKGVPIDGSLSEYVAKMKKAGFKYLGEEDGIAILKGDFAGVKGCTIGVFILQATNNVSKISVCFPVQNDWAYLEHRYEQLKSMLTKKYGNPSDCIEVFQKDRSSDTDNDKLTRLQLNQGTWFTTFSTPKGEIELSIERDDVLQCFVMLRYYDKINTDKVKAQAMDDL